MNLDGAQARARRFVEERDWVQFHTPKNLAMALICEAAELVEIFQWRSEAESRELAGTDDFQRVCEELADVQIYILRLADVLGIDLERAVESKQSVNEERYPLATSKSYVAKYSRGARQVPFLLRPYRPDDADAVVELVADALDRLYPSGRAWLCRKLREVEAGRADCTVAEVEADIVGLSIETIKQPKRRKLSTIWVRESMRRMGIGSALIAACCAGWRDKGVEQVYATASLDVMNAVMPLLIPVGFQFKALEPHRYGPDRHEIVLEWTPGSVLSSPDPQWVTAAPRRIRERRDRL